MILLGSNGIAPVFTRFGSGSGNATTPWNFATGYVAGDTVFVVQRMRAGPGLFASSQFTISDTRGTVFTLINSQTQTTGANAGAQVQVWMAQGVAPGAVTLTITPNGLNSANVSSEPQVFRITNLAAVTSSPGYSQVLKATNFAFSIPSTQAVTGIEVELFGHQTTLSADAVITANLLLPNGTVNSKTLSAQLPLIDGLSFAGTPTEGWSLPLSAVQLNNPNFGVQLVAQAPGGEAANFFLYAVKLKVFLTPNPPQNFNW